MKILKVEVGRQPEVKQINDDLMSMQREVGGYIETAYFYDDVVLVCNENGKLDGSCPNREIDLDGRLADVIFGDFFLVGVNAGCLTDISDEMTEKYKDILSLEKSAFREWPELFGDER